MWIARDGNGKLFVYKRKPIKRKIVNVFVPRHDDNQSMELPKKWHREITFENSPQKCSLFIHISQGKEK